MWQTSNFIIWLFNLSILRVPDEGYSKNVSCALNLISTLLFNWVCFNINTIFFVGHSMQNTWTTINVPAKNS